MGTGECAALRQADRERHEEGGGRRAWKGRLPLAATNMTGVMLVLRLSFSTVFMPTREPRHGRADAG